MRKLSNEVALITGGGGGIGFEIANAMAKEGAKICLNDINEKALQQSVSKLIERYGEGSADYVVGSVSIKEEVDRMVDQVMEKFGKISILVNNAGGTLGTPIDVPFEDFSEENYDLLMDVNLKGTFLVSQAVVRKMKFNQRGKIINISSMGARTAAKDTLSNAAYTASKGGVSALTRILAAQLGSFGINVNAIAPGVIISGERMRNRIVDNPEVAAKMKGKIALENFGEPKDIANVAVFLATEDSRYMTGAILDVNGGGFMG